MYFIAAESGILSFDQFNGVEDFFSGGRSALFCFSDKPVDTRTKYPEPCFEFPDVFLHEPDPVHDGIGSDQTDMILPVFDEADEKDDEDSLSQLCPNPAAFSFQDTELQLLGEDDGHEGFSGQEEIVCGLWWYGGDHTTGLDERPGMAREVAVEKFAIKRKYELKANNRLFFGG